MYLKEGTLLRGGDYKIVRHISSGGFGNTYEGIDVSLDKRVAIKEFFVKDFCSRESDTTLVTISVAAKKPLINHLKQKFIGEARAIAKMEHENIVKVQALFEENGTAYYVMDYIDGESLGSLLKRRGSLPEQEAVPIILKVASALDYMHRQNCFHLDVKPANIMLRKDGKVILIDFGSSKQYAEVDGENTTTLAPCYTPGYAPTEQMNPRLTTFTAATDIYSLGATLYKMLTGMTPPSAIDLVNGEEVLSPLPDAISENVRDCVAKAMIPQRHLRMQHVEEFVKLMPATGTTAADEATLLAAKSQKEAERKARKKEETMRKAKRWLWIVLGVIVVCGAGIGINNYINNHPIPTAPPAKGSKKTPTNNKKTTPATPAKGSNGASTNNKTATPTTPATYSNGTLTVKGVTYKMVAVSGGTFTMGATSEQVNPDSDEKPTHQVTLYSYSIGQTEVTQALWKAVMGSNPSNNKGDNFPVECVSWDDCQSFIKKLNSLTGESFRLPTEAEWEYAARGGNNSHHQYSGSNNLGDVAWYSGNAGGKTHPVATKPANELGLYDMSGNVWEWCNDRYGNYSSSSQTNPKGPASGSDRVNRGGSWFSYAWCCRVAFRSGSTPGLRDNYLGLRLAL